MTHTSARVWQWVGIILILGLFGGAYWYFEVRAGLKTNTGSTQPQGTGSLASGLAGYWPLDNGSGTSATDASTNGNTGTLTNGPTWTTGQVGSAVEFDGTNDYIPIADTDTLDFGDGDDFTLSAWFYRDTDTTYDTLISKRGSLSAGDAGYTLILSDSLDLVVFEVSDGVDEYVLYSGVTFTTPGWHHVVVTWDQDTESNVQMYVDGVQSVGSRGGTLANIGSLTNALSLYIGSLETLSHHFDGKLDEARIYDRTLSVEEVKDLYRLTVPTGVDTSLKGYWGFNGGDVSGTTAFDRSGAGNTGTLTNGPTVASGRVGQGLNFTASTNVVSTVASTATAFGTGDFSYGAWVKTTGYSNQGSSVNTIVARGYLAQAAGYGIGFTSANVPICYVSNDGTTSGGTVLNDGQWHFVMLVRRSNVVECWQNGVKLTDGATTSNITSSESLNFGNDSAGPNNRGLVGKLDEVRMYNRALSGGEIKGLYDVGESDKINSSVSQAQGTGRLDSGLAGYWKMDDGSGTSATDSSTNGITGTLTNGPTWTTGQIGGAVDLDGTDDYINLSTTHNYTSQDFSISHWAKFDSLTTQSVGQGPVTIYKGAYQVNGYYAQVSTVGVVSFLTNQSGANQTSSTPTGTIVAGNWYHMTYVRKGASVRIYINGVDSTSTVATHINPSSSFDNFEFGRYAPGNIEMNGQVDELRVYDRVLSADEVAQLYRLTAPTGVDTSLKGYWSFNAPDMASTTAYDRSGVGNTGTLTNSPTKAVGPVGQALSFDGTNDYVHLGNNGLGTDLNGSTLVTLSAWIRPTAYPAGSARKRVISIDIGSSQTGLLLGLYNSGGNLLEVGGRSQGGDSFQSVTVTGPSLNEWHFVSGVIDIPNDTISVYMDGVLMKTQTVTFGAGSYTNGASPAPDTIGSFEGGSEYFTGSIDEARVYNRALSVAEIKGLYDMGQSDKVNSSVSQPQGTGRLDSGLAGYWKLDENTGTSAADSSTNANAGTLTNGPTWTTGQIGGAVNFDGTDDYIDLGDLPVTESAPALTWSLWVNPANFSAGLRSLIAKFNNDNTQTSWMVETGNANAAGLIVAIPTTTTDGSTYGEVTTAVLTVSTWNLVTVVFDGTQTGNSNRLKIYVNGVQMLVTYTGTIPSTTQATTSNARIAAKSNLTGYFPGLVDEVRIYNRALSADEVAELYRLTAPTGTDTSLKGYWSFNGKDISGTTAFDQSGVGNNGTLTNSPTKTIGKIGQALSFDGSNDYVITGVATPYQFANTTFTVTGWFKKTGTLTEALVSQGGCNGGWVIFLASGTLQPVIKGTGACGTQPASRSSSTTTLNDGTWHHFAAVMTTNTTTPASNTLSIYIDGALNQGSLSQDGTSYVTSAINLQMGARNGGSDNPLTGSLDEVRIYSRALSASEITALYNSSR